LRECGKIGKHASDDDGVMMRKELGFWLGRRGRDA